MPGILLIIPPLTQLNTPYPATAYLTGFLRQQGIACTQADLGLDMVLALFNQQGLTRLFDEIEQGNFNLSDDLRAILANRLQYEQTIDAVISFLQNNNYTLAYRIARRVYLPEGPRFGHLQQMELFFGSIGTQDKARYLATMYLEDLSDLITSTVGPHFGFSKYAERISQTAVSFEPIHQALQAPDNYLDRILLAQAERYFTDNIPDMVGFTVPFPGNLYGALKIAQWIKQNHPSVRIALGGGYANTELRDLYDPTIFKYVDFITLDDGEAPILGLFNHISDPQKHPYFKRTFICDDGKVKLVNDLPLADFAHKQVPAPVYDGLRLSEYLSMFDVPNPMHRLWNDGRWNKLTIAHGCYWKRCSFCDISLDYIQRFDQSPAAALVDKMEALIKETGETGFHFVDEAAPPLAMRDLAIELLSRGLQVTWWTNIRFEKTFTPDLCKLLAASGCIAVTGGLEVADQRLLDLIEKGITIEQVAHVCRGFRDAGILVHAYLMYGFPTQTEQETIDSLEVVRQLFQHGLLQSAFWHQFAMTVHSPVGRNPEKYKVVRTGPDFKGFANNDLFHDDPTGADHGLFSDGLKKALYNYMHGHGLDWPLHDFFDFLVPHTQVPSKLIAKHLKRNVYDRFDNTAYRFAWHGVQLMEQKNTGKVTQLTFVKQGKRIACELPQSIATSLLQLTGELEITGKHPVLAADLVSQWAKMLSTGMDDVVKQPWYISLRKELLWLIRV